MPAGTSSPSFHPHPERSARLACDLSPSFLLSSLLLLAAMQALALLWICALYWPLAAFFSLVVIGIGVWERRRLQEYAGQLSTRERRWFWRGTDGHSREFEFHGELVLWRWLIVINGRDTAGRRLRLVLARDSASADDWRRLHTALRYSRPS